MQLKLTHLNLDCRNHFPLDYCSDFFKVASIITSSLKLCKVIIATWHFYHVHIGHWKPVMRALQWGVTNHVSEIESEILGWFILYGQLLRNKRTIASSFLLFVALATKSGTHLVPNDFIQKSQLEYVISLQRFYEANHPDSCQTESWRSPLLFNGIEKQRINRLH